MRKERAAVAGIAGAVAMSLAMALVRLFGGVNISLEYMLGSLFGVEGLLAWIGGFVLHLASGALAGIIYALIFEYAFQRSGPGLGALFGIVHGLTAGLLMSAIPAMNPLISDSPTAPGPFLRGIAYGPLLFLGLHILFGAVVGWVYGPVKHRPHELRHSPIV